MRDDQRHLIEQLADEFLSRTREGEDLSISGFVSGYPEHADQLRDFIEALQLVNDLKRDVEPNPVASTDDPASDRFPKIDDFKIIREIGRGGMGIVYEAEQLSLSRRVAIKTIAGSNHQSDVQRERFQREARTAARLHHPNIVPVHEVGESNDSLYFAMQLIDGRGLDRVMRTLVRISESPASDGLQDVDSSLAHLLLSGLGGGTSGVGLRVTTPSDASSPSRFNSSWGPSTNTDSSGSYSSLSAYGHRRFCRSAATIGRQVASALSCAHNAGVIHRDIKPANLLLDSTGNTWVTDFGLVKVEESGLTQTGDFVGTLRYMSPERFAGQCDARSDIYALGITIYELLAGRPAYASPDQFSLLEQIRNTDPLPLRQIDKRIPRDLETIVAKAIQKEPSRRYQQAADLEADLQRYLSGEPILARKVSTPEKAWIWAKRSPLTASLLLLLSTLVLTISIGSTFAAFYFRASELEQTKLAEEAIRQRDAARQSAYFADMRTANQALQDGQIHHMLTILRQYVPVDGQSDLRGWEWYNLLSLPNEEKRIIENEATLQLEWIERGDRLITASRDGRLHIRDAEGRSIRRFDIPGLRGFALGPDSERIATFCDDSAVSIWELSTGKRLKEFDTDIQSIVDIDWNRQGDKIGVASKVAPRLQIIDLSIDALQPVISSTQVEHPSISLAFSPDGRFLALCNNDSQAQIWELDSQAWMDRNIDSHYHATSFAWHPNSQQFVEAAENEGFRLYEIVDAQQPSAVTRSTDKQIWEVENETTKTDLSFSPTGQYLLACGPAQRVEIFDVKKREITQVLNGHLGATSDADWHPTKPWVASCSLDSSIRLWDLSPKNPWAIAEEGRRTLRNSRGLSRDGRWKWQRVTQQPRFDNTEMTIIASDATTNAEVGRVKLPPSGISLFAPVFFSAGNRMLIVQAHQLYPDPQSVEENPFGDGLAYAQVYSIQPWKQLEGWEVAIASLGHPNYAVGGNLFIATDEQVGFIRILDFEKELDLRLKVHDDRLCLRLNPDHSRLATCSRGKITIWDTTTWKEVVSYSVNPNAEFRSVEWRSDGRYLVTGDTLGDAIIWDTTTHKRLHTLRGHQSSVDILGFSTDNSRLISASQNVHVWHVESGREILSYPRLNVDRTIDEFYLANQRIANMPDPQVRFDALDRANAITGE